VTVAAVLAAVGAMDTLACVAETKVSVAPSGMSVPVTLRPLSAAVKFAFSDVMFGATVDTVASSTARAMALSILNDVPAGIAPTVGRFSVTKHAPEIDVTKLCTSRPPTTVLEIVRFTKAVADVQSVAVNDVAPIAMAAVFVIVRAAPLCHTTLLKSWIVYVDDTKSPVPPVACWKMHATRR
jgi:hypothetical protein